MALLTGALKDVYDSLRKRDAEQKELIDRISRDVASLRAELAMKNFQAGGGLTAQQVCSRIQEAITCLNLNGEGLDCEYFNGDGVEPIHE